MDTQQDDSSALREFEQSLETLLLEAFARGVPLEGRWQITLNSPNLPDWSIQISEKPPAQPEYDPDFIEE
ncbi:hypothetical protein [Haloprofundus sp. MHR1]|uniref:hypothetical protein n=1 Tax=Haloprofundus sp. MHR1 TaxID=2572921 RepID=UPI0010BF380E|nr:hypothetical protein [Haloprofundus sp. MHR1]QCJ45860.1 hypothetical protein FCF25_01430 [Haloprofundus sp. MHR1]